MLYYLAIFLFILLIYVFYHENFSTMIRNITSPQLRVNNLRKGCQGISSEQLIQHYGSEKILREIMLSKGLPRDIDIQTNSAAIADFLSGYNSHINPMFSPTC